MPPHLSRYLTLLSFDARDDGADSAGAALAALAADGVAATPARAWLWLRLYDKALADATAWRLDNASFAEGGVTWDSMPALALGQSTAIASGGVDGGGDDDDLALASFVVAASAVDVLNDDGYLARSSADALAVADDDGDGAEPQLWRARALGGLTAVTRRACEDDAPILTRHGICTQARARARWARRRAARPGARRLAATRLLRRWRPRPRPRRRRGLDERRVDRLLVLLERARRRRHRQRWRRRRRRVGRAARRRVSPRVRTRENGRTDEKSLVGSASLRALAFLSIVVSSLSRTDRRRSQADHEIITTTTARVVEIGMRSRRLRRARPQHCLRRRRHARRRAWWRRPCPCQRPR